MLVRGRRVDISPVTICCFMYGTSTDIAGASLTPEFDYMWDMVKSGQKTVEKREAGKRWPSQHLSTDGEGADWVLDPRGMIKKADLPFTAKFFWLLVRHRLSPTTADNILTWDRSVLVASLEIDFAKLLITVIHERDFKSSTTYPFVCLIFHLFKDVEVPIWHCNTL